jgi:excisionase family DNA binding protein
MTPVIDNEHEPAGLLTVEQISKWLGVSKRTIANLTARRKIPFVKVGRCVRFKLRDVEKAIEKMTVKSI